MNRTRVWQLALGLGVAVAVLPWLIPTGPAGGVDILSFLSGGRLLAGGLLAFGYGLLTALTPCVYPLIPITVSVFGARKAEGRGKALVLTSAYVLGMGLVFAALGVLAARTGAVFGSQLGRPAVTLPIAAVLLVLASSMFGAFELNLPPALANRLSSVGGAGLLGALLMGSVAGFLAAPCTGPALLGLLTFVAQTQSSVLGGSLLFVYALGMGVPFFLIGAFAVKLPKSGTWMEGVKSVLGIILVAMAVIYVKDSFAPVRSLVVHAGEALGSLPGAWLAGALAALGVGLGAVHLSFKHEQVSPRALKAAGVLLVTVGLVLRVAALSAPSSGRAWVALGWAKAPKPTELAWALKFGTQPTPQVELFERTLARARSEGRPVMIDFFAEWCAACKELDRETYVSPSVVNEANRFIAIKVDATNSEGVVDQLQERFHVQGLPTVAFISSRGEVLQAPRVTGFLGPDEFIQELKKVE